MAPSTSSTGAVMSFEDYLELPGDLRAEYVHGRVLVNPPPTIAHQKICLRLARRLEDALGPGAEVLLATGWRLSGGTVRIPDVMVLSTPQAGLLVTDIPVAVVEVLSSNRDDDLVRKSEEYLRAGVPQFWVVDPRRRTLDVLENDSGWQTVLRLTANHPQGRVWLPRLGIADLDLTDLLVT